MDNLNEMQEHDRRRIGAALLEVLNQIRKDPEAMAKVRARAAEIGKEAKTA